MPTENPRITFMVSADMLEKITEYRFNHRIKNQSQAVLDLLERGIHLMEGREYIPQAQMPSDAGLSVGFAYDNAPELVQSVICRALEPYMQAAVENAAPEDGDVYEPGEEQAIANAAALAAYGFPDCLEVEPEEGA